MALIRYTLVRNLIITGNKLLELLYIFLIVITWLLIIVWVLLNGGLISTSDSKQSTLGLKVKESISTNFTDNDFDTNYVKPEEIPYYNRIWDPEDISHIFPEEIHIMTNLVITANQTQSTCPESPLITGTICNPKENYCKRGRKMMHGVETGECVPGDFKYYNDKGEWMYGHDCQVRGWCPVDRIWLPLKGFAPVLKDTQESTLWLKNTIRFDEHNIVFDNQPNPDIAYYLKCRYNPKSDPNCPIFILKDILKYSENNNQSYALMARYGATINMKIEWNCFLPPFREFDSTKDCQIKYSFLRIDNEKRLPATGYTTYRQIFLYDNGITRTHWRTFRLRIRVDVKALLSRYNLFKFISLTIAYNGIFSLVLWLFSKRVKSSLIRFGYQIDETLDISVGQDHHQVLLQNNESAELVSNEYPIDMENEISIYESTTERPTIELRQPFDKSSD